MTALDDAALAALKAAAERAEPKVWRQGVDYDDGALIAPDSNDWLAYFSVSGDPPDADGARLDFVALANPATILALLARLDAAERTAQHYRLACAEADDRAQAADARAERLAAENARLLSAGRELHAAAAAVDALKPSDRKRSHLAIACAGWRDAARAALAAERGEAAQRTERSPAERFAAAILLPCLRGDRSVVEGWAIEEAALAAGLIKEVQAQEPCGARCACSDLGVGFPTTCNRLTEAGKALLGEAE